jgi:hypothetical protein
VRVVLKHLKNIAIAIAATLASLCALAAAVVAIGTMCLHREVERKISVALNGHFPGELVSVNDRVDFGYLEYGNQICFDVTVTSPKTGSTRRNIVMIDGDDDGGTWAFGAVYASMRDCEDGFDRG